MSDALVDGSIFRKDSSGNYWQLVEERAEIDCRLFGIKSDGTLNSQADLDKLFTAAKNMGRHVYFPYGKKGTYVFPLTFSFNFGYSDCGIIGDPKKTPKITSFLSGGTTFRIPERVDVTKPRIPGNGGQDGFYVIDTIGTTDSSWTGISSTGLDGYIKVVSGVVSPSSLSEVMAAGWIAELDVEQADPGIDGRYVVAHLNYATTGGAYSHYSLPYNTSVKILAGAYLQRSGGVWSRPNPTDGFICGGNIIFRNIKFEDCAFYIITPTNKVAGNTDFDQYTIEDCEFNHVLRVNALDRQNTNSTYPGVQGFRKGSNYHFADGQNFNYKEINLKRNKFSYVHTCVFWEYPPTRKLTVWDNIYRKMFTLQEMSVYLPMSSGTPADDEDSEGYTSQTVISIANNIVEDVRNYSPVSTGGMHIFRTNGKSEVLNNRIYNCNRTHFYLTGTGHDVRGNILVPFLDCYAATDGHPAQPVPPSGPAWAEPILFHIKGGDLVSSNAIFLSNNRVEKAGYYLPLDLKADSNYDVVVSNCKLQSAGYAGAILATDTEINRQFMYKVVNLANFQTLAGAGKYDVSIVQNDFVYWDIRRTKWMKMPSAVGRDQSVIEKNYSYNFTRKIIFNNCELYGACLVSVVDGNVNEVQFNHCDLYVFKGLYTNSSVDYLDILRLKGNNIYRGLGSAPAVNATASIKKIHADGNYFYINGAANPIITFDDRCEWNHNYILPWKKYDQGTTNNADLGTPMAGGETAIKFISQASGQLLVRGGTIDSWLSRSGCVQFVGCDTVEFDSVHFRARLWYNPSTGNFNAKRAVFYFGAADGSPTNFRINNPRIEFENVTNKYLFAIQNTSPVLTITNLILKNIQTVGPVMSKVLYTISGTIVITNLYLMNSEEIPEDTAFLAIPTAIFRPKVWTSLGDGSTTQMAIIGPDGSVGADVVPSGGGGGGGTLFVDGNELLGDGETAATKLHHYGGPPVYSPGSVGIPVITALGPPLTVITRQIVGSGNIKITNPNGVSGNMTIGFGNCKVLTDANYTVLDTDCMLVLPTTTTVRTLTLPAAGGATFQNKIIILRVTGTGAPSWVLSGSFVQPGTNFGGAISEDFVNSGLISDVYYLVSALDGSTWRWFSILMQ